MVILNICAELLNRYATLSKHGSYPGMLEPPQYTKKKFIKEALIRESKLS